MAKSTVMPEEPLAQMARPEERTLQGGPPELTEAAPRMAVTSHRGLNLRLGPGQDFDVVSVLPEGAAVTVWQTWADGRDAQGWFDFHVPGWAYVFTGELCGWVNDSYLAPLPPAEIV